MDWSNYNKDFFSQDRIDERLKKKSDILTAGKIKTEGSFQDKAALEKLLHGTFQDKTKDRERIARIGNEPAMLTAQYGVDPKRHQEKMDLVGLGNQPSMLQAQAHKGYYDFLASPENPQARMAKVQEDAYSRIAAPGQSTNLVDKLGYGTGKKLTDSIEDYDPTGTSSYARPDDWSLEADVATGQPIDLQRSKNRRRNPGISTLY